MYCTCFDQLKSTTFVAGLVSLQTRNCHSNEISSACKGDFVCMYVCVCMCATTFMHNIYLFSNNYR